MRHTKIKLSRRQMKRAKAKAYEDLITDLRASKDRIRQLEQANKLLHIAIDAAQERANKAEMALRESKQTTYNELISEMRRYYNLKGE